MGGVTKSEFDQLLKVLGITKEALDEGVIAELQRQICDMKQLISLRGLKKTAISTNDGSEEKNEPSSSKPDTMPGTSPNTNLKSDVTLTSTPDLSEASQNAKDQRHHIEVPAAVDAHSGAAKGPVQQQRLAHANAGDIAAGSPVRVIR